MGSLGHPFSVEQTESRITYFGYGSNMWRDQMRRRCTESEYVGIGILRGWKWIINVSGAATIVPSELDIVYGLLYEISQRDMDELDKYEYYYDKVLLDVEVHKAERDDAEKIHHNTLVYIDRRDTESLPRTEYIYRMNQAIASALKEGVPQEYIDKYLRKFIPAEPSSLPN